MEGKISGRQNVMALNFEVEEIKGHLKKEIAINLKDIEKFRFKRLFNILLIFLLFFHFMMLVNANKNIFSSYHKSAHGVSNPRGIQVSYIS